MTEQEASAKAWRVAEADLEEANSFYEIPQDDAYEIEPLAADYTEVRDAIEDLIATYNGYNSQSQAEALVRLEDEINRAVSDIKHELEMQEQLREEYPW